MTGVTFDTYPKIYSPFKRNTDGPNRNKLKLGEWYRPEFDETQNLTWIWTEKVDGTNIRIHWDGHKVHLGGRTDNAQIPATLVSYLRDTFFEELFEQEFKQEPVTLFGEGYGKGIQKAGNSYSPNGVHFRLFDVKIDKWWLLDDSIYGVASALGVSTVPDVHVGNVWDAIQIVQDGLNSAWGDFYAEGLVGHIRSGLLARNGDRIQMKVKHKDFFEVEYV